MSVCVIELLEFVKIQHHNGQRLYIIITVRPLYFSFKLSVKMYGIVKLREVVYYALFTVFFFAFLEHILHSLALGDVSVVDNYSFNNIIMDQVTCHTFKCKPASILMTKMHFTFNNRGVCILGQSIECVS